MKEDEHFLRIVSMTTILALCFTALLLALTVPGCSTASPVHADSGTITSSPASGPVGTTIVVNGSNLMGSAGTPTPDNTPVTFGYDSNTGCSSPTSTGNPASVSNGSFSGSFTWPSTAAGTYAVCVTINGTTTPSSSTFTVMTPRVSTNKTSYTVGQNMIVTGSNFPLGGVNISIVLRPANGGATVYFGTISSDFDGTFSQDFTVPKHPIGSDVIVASTSAISPTLSATSTTFTVHAAPTPTPTATPVPTANAAPNATATPTATAQATATDTPAVVQPTDQATTPVQSTVPRVINNSSTPPRNQGSKSLPLPFLPLVIGMPAAILVIALVGAFLYLRRSLPSLPKVLRPSGARPWSRVRGPSLQGNQAPLVESEQTIVINSPFVPNYGGQPARGAGNIPTGAQQGIPNAGFLPGNSAYPAWGPGSVPPNAPQMPFPPAPGPQMGPGNVPPRES